MKNTRRILSLKDNEVEGLHATNFFARASDSVSDVWGKHFFVDGSKTSSIFLARYAIILRSDTNTLC